MGIRLRSFRAHKTKKTIAFVMAILTLTAAFFLLAMGRLTGGKLESVIEKQYTNSNTYENEVQKALSTVTEYYYSNDKFIGEPYYYRVQINSYVYTNTNNIQINLYHPENEYYSLENGIWKSDKTRKEIVRTYISSNMTGYVLFPAEYLQQMQQEWLEGRSRLMGYMIAFFALTALGISFIILLVAGAGKQLEKGQIKLHSFDTLYPDLILISFLLVLMIFLRVLPLLIVDDHTVGMRIDWYWFDVFTDFKGEFAASVILFCIVLIPLLSGCLLLLLSLVRKLRAGNFIRNSMTYRLVSYLYKAFSMIYRYLFYGNLFHEESLTKLLYYRQLVVIVSTVSMFLLIYIFTCMESPLIIIPAIIQATVLYWYAKGNVKLFADVESDMQESLDDQVKSERMKVALLTNVSHDLKTPLTSIISYIDLLSQEEGMSETAMDYIRILQGKSDRLKNIVTDLFDLAKSTSGAIQLENEIIDLKRLMEQTLVEMEDRIENSGLQVKAKLPETQVMIRSDGKKLYRVFQNVLDNALKYSMKETRIYIELKQDEKEAVVTIKNIAGYEMDFTSEEILQRFTRGDKARSEEGSGLGLSIAESFTKVSGGDFQVEIDGDLFKVKMTFPLSYGGAVESVA